VSGGAACSICHEQPGVWRLNPQHPTRVGLVEMMEADLDIDPVQLLEAATTDLSTDLSAHTYCAVCADYLVTDLSENVPKDLAKDAADRKATLLARERDRLPVEVREAWLDRVEQIADTIAARQEEEWRHTPILVRVGQRGGG
jgi:hypothetical protein